MIWNFLNLCSLNNQKFFKATNDSDEIPATTSQSYERIFGQFDRSTYTIKVNLLRSFSTICDWFFHTLNLAFADFVKVLHDLQEIKYWLLQKTTNQPGVTLQIYNRVGQEDFSGKNLTLTSRRNLSQTLDLIDKLPQLHANHLFSDYPFLHQYPINLIKQRIRSMVKLLLSRKQWQAPPRAFGPPQVGSLTQLDDLVSMFPATDFDAWNQSLPNELVTARTDYDALVQFKGYCDNYFLQNDVTDDPSELVLSWLQDRTRTLVDFTSKLFQAMMETVQQNPRKTFEEILAMITKQKITALPLDEGVLKQQQVDVASNFPTTQFSEGLPATTSSVSSESSDMHKDANLSNLTHAPMSSKFTLPADIRSIQDILAQIFEDWGQSDQLSVRFLQDTMIKVNQANHMGVAPLELYTKLKSSIFFEWLSTVHDLSDVYNVPLDSATTIRGKNVAVFKLMYSRSLTQIENILAGFGQIAPWFSAISVTKTFGLVSKRSVAYPGATGTKFMVLELLVSRPGKTTPQNASISMVPIYFERVTIEDLVQVDDKPFYAVHHIINLDHYPTEAEWNRHSKSSFLMNSIGRPTANAAEFSHGFHRVLEESQKRGIYPIITARNAGDFLFFQQKMRFWHDNDDLAWTKLAPFSVIIPPEVSEAQLKILAEAIDVENNISLHEENRTWNMAILQSIELRAKMVADLTVPRIATVFSHHPDTGQQVQNVMTQYDRKTLMKGPYCETLFQRGSWGDLNGSSKCFYRHLLKKPVPVIRPTKFTQEQIDEVHQLPNRHSAWQHIRDLEPARFAALETAFATAHLPSTTNAFKTNLKELLENEPDRQEWELESLTVPMTSFDFWNLPMNKPFPVTNMFGVRLMATHPRTWKGRSFGQEWANFGFTDLSRCFEHDKPNPFSFVLNTTMAIAESLHLGIHAPVSINPAAERLMLLEPEFLEKPMEVDWSLTFKKYRTSISQNLDWTNYQTTYASLSKHDVYFLELIRYHSKEERAPVSYTQRPLFFQAMLHFTSPTTNSDLYPTAWHQYSTECFTTSMQIPVQFIHMEKAMKSFQILCSWQPHAETHGAGSYFPHKPAHERFILCPKLTSAAPPSDLLIPIETICYAPPTHQPTLKYGIAHMELYRHQTSNIWRTGAYSPLLVMDSVVLYNTSSMTGSGIIARIMNPLAKFYRFFGKGSAKKTLDQATDTRMDILFQITAPPRDQQQFFASLASRTVTELRRVKAWTNQIDALLENQKIVNPPHWQTLTQDQWSDRIVVDSDVWTAADQTDTFNSNFRYYEQKPPVEYEFWHRS